MMRGTGLAGVVVATLLAGGCASKTSAGSGVSAASGATPSKPSAPVLTQNDCSSFTTSLTAGNFGVAQTGAGSLPADAHPVSLLRCEQDDQDVSGDGQWLVVKTVRSTGSVDGFVSALRASYAKPPAPKPKGDFACADVAYLQPWIALIDADGKAYRVSIPSWGVCDDPDPDVTKALAAVSTTTVSTERIRQTMSQGAQSSGCAQQFAEMAFVGAQQGFGTGTTGPFFSRLKPGDPIRACFYKLSADYEKVKPAGDFDSVTTLSGSQAAVVFDGLVTAPVATVKTCAAPATEYAVLSAADGGDWSVVELGGCGLAAPDSGPDRTVPATVVQALSAAKK
jgi:hypothetical protein